METFISANKTHLQYEASNLKKKKKKKKKKPNTLLRQFPPQFNESVC